MNTAQKMMTNRPGQGYGDMLRNRIESGFSYNSPMAQQEHVAQLQRHPFCLQPEICDYYECWNHLSHLVRRKAVVARISGDIEDAIEEWGYSPPSWIVL